MVASDGRLPHQIFTRGKMNNSIETLSSAHLQLQLNVTFRRQVVLTIEIPFWSLKAT